jgi:hypothetical protein
MDNRQKKVFCSIFALFQSIERRQWKGIKFIFFHIVHVKSIFFYRKRFASVSLYLPAEKQNTLKRERVSASAREREREREVGERERTLVSELAQAGPNHVNFLRKHNFF